MVASLSGSKGGGDIAHRRHSSQTWEQLLKKYRGRAHGKIVVDKILNAGGFVALYLDVARLPALERRALRPLLGPSAYRRLQEVREVASHLRMVDNRLSLESDAAAWFSNNGFRRLANRCGNPAPRITPEELMGKWGRGGQICADVLDNQLLPSAELMLDLSLLPPEECRRVWQLLDVEARRLVQQVHGLCVGLYQEGELKWLEPLIAEYLEGLPAPDTDCSKRH